MIPLREALAESRNAVAIWLTGQIGIASVLGTSRSLGVKTRLQPYATTALGASEVNLLELANAYRTMASGIFAEPYVIRKIVRDSGEVAADNEMGRSAVDVNDSALALIQEGLRGVVRIPTGTAHTLDSSVFPIAVMGKTGTTNEFRDALFVGSTLRPRRNHRRRPCRLRRQPFPRTRRNRRPGRAAGVQRTHAQSVPRKAGRPGADVPSANGTEH